MPAKAKRTATKPPKRWETLEAMLTGGHPNSLGRTVEVVELVLANRGRLEELFRCYESGDEVVRLRTSSALKRIEASRHDWLVPYLDRLIDDVGQLDQASAQWTLAALFLRLEAEMSADQKKRALKLLKRNLKGHDDWIVLNETIATLTAWARNQPALEKWIRPHLERLSADPRKSVSKRAAKAIDALA